MPEYEYECKNCKYPFSIVHGMLEVVQAYCPVCHTSNVTRRFSMVEPILNGKADDWGKDKWATERLKHARR
jgi:putative FmdB family regulatory protein